MRARVLAAADVFERSGFIVTRQLEVEAAGVAWLSCSSMKTLRNDRCQLRGPPSRTIRGRAWYPIADLLRWIDTMKDREGRCVLSESEASRSE